MEKLVVIHKTHLDIGFTDLAANVERQYLEGFIPASIERAAAMNEPGMPPRFIWTTGSWIIWKALEDPDAARREALENAIQKGWIAWHALPFTFHTELLTPGLLRLGLKFAQDLDARYGRETISAKMTDVPGHTLGLVPLLASAGVRFLHIGVNPTSQVPDVPPLFRWRCGNEEIVVAYNAGYGSLSQWPTSPVAMTFFHTNDNLGPPSAERIREFEEAMAFRHEGATIESGTMDDFARALEPFVQELPVVTDEIGDSWIHGAGSSPSKIADYLAWRRVIEEETAELVDTPLGEIAPWLEPLLLVPEHTWGLDVKDWMGDHTHLRPTELRIVARSKRVQLMEASWREQETYLDGADANLPKEWAAKVRAAVAESRERRRMPRAEGGSAVTRADYVIAGRWLVRFEESTGALVELYDRETGIEWTPPHNRHGWGLLRYELLGRETYERYLRDYKGPAPHPWPAVECFTRPGLPMHLQTTQYATLRIAEMRVETRENLTVVTLPGEFFGEEFILEGAPETFAMQWRFPHDTAAIEMTVGWDRKAASRLAEAAWLGFYLPPDVIATRLAKLGQNVDPETVVEGGGRSLHALDGPVTVEREAGKWAIESDDTPLVALDEPALATVLKNAPSGRNALWFNLFNNVWNTNFRLWQGGPLGYRFRIEHLAKAT